MTHPSTTPSLGLSVTWQPMSLEHRIELPRDELHVWCVPLQITAAQAEQALSILSSNQLDKYQRRDIKQLKMSYLAGRFYLNHLLRSYSNTGGDDIKLSYGGLNKPFLSDNPNQLHFNYTDTVMGNGAWGLFAFTRYAEVGVDLESLQRQTNFKRISQRRFSPAEQDFVTQTDGTIDPQRFLAIWTRKEAYGKATGRGINFSMRDLDLASPGEHHLEFTDNSKPTRAFQLTQLQMDPGLISAVVVEDQSPRTLKAFSLSTAIP